MPSLWHAQPGHSSEISHLTMYANGVYFERVEFIETSVFTRQVTGLLSDEEYKRLQWELVLNPLVGKLIPQSGGLRKVRWASSGRGKRGGVRVIYYYLVQQETIFLLLAYSKTEKDDLSHDELRVLRRVVQEELA